MQSRVKSGVSVELRRKGLMALVAASAGLALLGAADSAYGTTFTFATAGGDFQDPNNWTPTGVPIATDLAFIRTLTGPVLTISAGAMTLGAILDDTSNNITLSNATSDATNSTLTLAGLPNTALINLDRAVAGTTFTIQGANSGGGTGTLGPVLGASGTFNTSTNTSSNSTLVITANISETGGARSITKAGAGTLILAGSNSFTGALTVNLGTAILSGSNSLSSLEAHRGAVTLDFTSTVSPKIVSSGSLIFSGANFTMTGNAAQNVNQTVSGTYITAGQSAANFTVTGTGTLASLMNTTLNAGDFHRSTGAYLNINYSSVSSVGGVAVVATSTGNDAYGIVGGWLTVGNDDWATNSSGTISALTSHAVKNDVTTWAAGDNITNASTAYTGSIANDLTIGSLRFSDQSSTNTVAIAPGKTLTIGSGGILLAGSTTTTHTISGGSLTSGVGEIIATTGSNKTLSISSVIGDNGAAALTVTKSGSGTMSLTGANTFTGGVYINTGTLNTNTLANTGQPSSLGANGTIYIGSTNPGRINYSGSTTATNRNFVLGEGGATILLNANSSTITLSGSIDGPGSLTKGGGANGAAFSALVILGSKTFGGAITVNPGLLSVDTLAPIGTPSSLGTGTLDPTLTLGNGTAATLEFRGSALTSTADRTLQLGLPGGSNGGSINLTMTQPVSLTWNGNMLWNSGQPSSSSNNGTSITFATGPANVRPFRVDTPGTITFNGSIGSGNAIYGQLQKFGSGTVILGGTNGYALGTVVNAGTLITNTNFSNGTITNLTSTTLTGLNVTGSAVAKVAAKPANDDPAGVTALPSLAVGSSAQFDLTNNGLLIYNATSAASQIRGLLKTGYNNGSWNGVGGIISSSAAATSATSHKTALGYAQAGELFTSFPATFNGQTLPDATDTIVGYVMQGDTNLDGRVNALDFNAIATNFGAANPSWAMGDVNYDDTVNTLDFQAMAMNFNQTTLSPSASLGALVPEPACAVLFGMLGGLIAARRRAR